MTPWPRFSPNQINQTNLHKFFNQNIIISTQLSYYNSVFKILALTKIRSREKPAFSLLWINLLKILIFSSKKKENCDKKFGGNLPLPSCSVLIVWARPCDCSHSFGRSFRFCVQTKGNWKRFWHADADRDGDRRGGAWGLRSFLTTLKWPNRVWDFIGIEHKFLRLFGRLFFFKYCMMFFNKVSISNSLFLKMLGFRLPDCRDYPEN